MTPDDRLKAFATALRYIRSEAARMLAEPGHECETHEALQTLDAGLHDVLGDYEPLIERVTERLDECEPERAREIHLERQEMRALYSLMGA